MANDVKALPVVAYMWMFRDSVWDISSMKGRYLSMGEDHTEHPLVCQSDAESALAELRAEVERLRQRADTAEARLERARGLLRQALLIVQRDADSLHESHTIEGEWPEDDADVRGVYEHETALAADIDAFLGEGK